jgi:hypothetical protein
MVVKGGRLVATKEAPVLRRKPWTPTFVAAVFRGFMKSIDLTHVTIARFKKLEAKQDDIDAQVEELVQQRLQRERARVDGDLGPLRQSLADFEQATGRKLSAYNGASLGPTVRLAETLQSLPSWGLEDTIARLERARTACQDALTALKDAQGVPDATAPEKP